MHTVVITHGVEPHEHRYEVKTWFRDTAVHEALIRLAEDHERAASPSE